MSDQLFPGTHSEVSSTMATAMESAFLREWTNFNGDLPVPTGADLDSIRLFFVAVSQGIVRHLKDNPEAFQVEVTSGTGTLQGAVSDIVTAGTVHSATPPS
jgi:hypothetical protein